MSSANFLTRYFFLIVFLLMPTHLFGGSHNSGAFISLEGPGKVLVLRHALAPGTGDPDNFTIDDCTTQRNLDGQGREQAMEIGDRLREAGFANSKVYTSQWCRCKETAQLMNLGPVIELPAINSFFRNWQQKDQQMNDLRKFLSLQEASGELIILVTHQVNITALTDVFPASGTGVLLELDGSGGFDIGPTVSFE